MGLILTVYDTNDYFYIREKLYYAETWIIYKIKYDRIRPTILRKTL